MGFKPGDAIGKRPGSTREPISIEVKRGRTCLGQKSVAREREEKKEALADVSSFRSRLQNNSAAANTKWDLNKAQRVCRNLDEKVGILTPLVEPWYWPPQPKPKPDTDEEFHDSEEEDEDAGNIISPEGQLEAVINYLRTTYFYCLWCGAAFDDAQDLTNSCPGNRDDH